ncbi:MAG: hypothetical protein ACRD0C_05650 [Acidimicrobiia bacterium]
MPLRLRRSLVVLCTVLGGVGAGVAVSAGAASDGAAPSAFDYEIVRATFSAGGETAEGTARCSDGKFVFGGGGRVLGEGVPGYTLVASDPTGPSGWTAAFVRTAEPEPPLVPGGPAEEEDETEFEISAVCAAPGG